MIFILDGVFQLIKFENSKINRRIGALGFLLQLIYFSRIFWHKNNVQRNKKRAFIKINSFLEKSLNFNQIETTELNENKLVITKFNGIKVI